MDPSRLTRIFHSAALSVNCGCTATDPAGDLTRLNALAQQLSDIAVLFLVYENEFTPFRRLAFLSGEF